MHIPDGFLDAKTIVTTAAISTAVIAYSVKKSKSLSEKQVPFLGVMAAFVFAAQMINFPIIGGTSGHLIGGTLSAIIFGPHVASIIITTVLMVQAIFFQDGGITALGANILNMAVISCFVGYYIYLYLSKFKTTEKIAVFAASWISVFLSAVAASFELAFSNTIPLKIVLPAMSFWHAFIGIGEAIITVAVVSFINSLEIKNAFMLQKEE